MIHWSQQRTGRDNYVRNLVVQFKVWRALTSELKVNIAAEIWLLGRYYRSRMLLAQSENVNDLRPPDSIKNMLDFRFGMIIRFGMTVPFIEIRQLNGFLIENIIFSNKIYQDIHQQL